MIRKLLLVVSCLLPLAIVAGYWVLPKTVGRTHFEATISADQSRMQIVMQCALPDETRRLATLVFPPEVVVENGRTFSGGWGTLNSDELLPASSGILGAFGEQPPAGIGRPAWAFRFGSHSNAVSESTLIVDGHSYNLKAANLPLQLDFQAETETAPTLAR
jgi:hypothetical protein